MITTEQKKTDLQAELLLDAKAVLGEGPVWNTDTHRLLWVDIKKGEVHNLDISSKQDIVIYSGEKVGCAVPAQGNSLVVADKRTIFSVDSVTPEKKPLAEVELCMLNNRFNDGKADAKGRLWVGTMDEGVKEGAGSLYCMDSDGEIFSMLSKRTISNGMDWTNDNKTMYYIDSWDQSIYAFDFDLETGGISNQRVVVQVPKELGTPDGMTLDEEGHLWVAIWGGSCVACWDPITGELLEKISVPAINVSSCAFGGEKMDQFFITTARDGMTSEQLNEYPLSGGIFVCMPGTTGRPSHKVKVSL